MKRLTYTVVKNAIANVVRGGASAIVALVLPHFLTHALDQDRFAAWALLLQLSAYVNYLDFGLQTAVARYLAQAVELGDEGRRDQVVNTAFGLLSGAGLLAFSVLAVIAWRLPAIFHSIPPQSLSDVRLGLMVLTGSAVLALPLSAFTGVLIGLHRNEYPALAIGGSRILGAAAILLTIRYTNSLAALALCLGGCNLLGSVAQILIVRQLVPGLRLRLSNFSRLLVREFISYCSALTVWSFGMLFIGGLDVTIVGYFNFSAAGYYSIAITLIGFFTGLNSSVFAAMLTPVAVLQARQDYDRIQRLITVATRLNTYACMTVTMMTFLWGRKVLQMWVGPVYADQVLPILEILLVAQTIRLIGSAYGTTLVATGQQRYGLVGVVAEGILNLALSIFGVMLIGATGVAWATLVAAIAGVTILLSIVMRWVPLIAIRRGTFIREAILKPAFAFLPIGAWLLSRSWYADYFRLSMTGERLLLSAALLATIALIIAGLGQLRRLGGGLAS